MIRSLIICFGVIILWIPEISGQQYFSRSLDIAESGNNIFELVANEEEILISNLVNCPVPGPGVSCGGFHIYNHQKDSLMGEYFLSTYPKHLYPCFAPIDFGDTGDIHYCVIDVIHQLNLTATIVSVSREGDFKETFRFSDCPGTTCFPRGLTASNEGGYLMYGHQRDTIKEQGGGSYFLLKLDEDLNVDWYNYYEVSHWEVTSIRDITQLPNGNIAMTGWIGGNTNRILAIVVTDSQGNELWRRIINTNPNRQISEGLPFASPLGEDKLLVSWLYWKPHYPEQDIWGGTYPFFYVFDNEGNEVRTNLLDQAIDFRYIDRVKPSADGGVIGVGVFQERPRISGEVEFRGYIFRLDDQGDLLWEKTYWDISHIPEDRDHASNYFMDVVELPDGRIVAGGGRRDTVGPGVLNSNGWLVMLDEHGECPSEEGCEHLEIRDLTVTSTTDIEVSVDIPVIEVFPNPASVEVFVRIPEFTEGSIQIYNIHGQLVHNELSVRHQTQIDIGHWHKGLYIVHFRSSDGRLLLKDKLVVLGD